MAFPPPPKHGISLDSWLLAKLGMGFLPKFNSPPGRKNRGELSESVISFYRID